MTELQSLLKEISRPCTVFDVGGFRPTQAIEESWLGRVSRFRKEEGIPEDRHGNPMLPLGQFYLPALPFVPKSLSGISLLTVFLSSELEGDSDLMDGCWEVREYTDIDDLEERTSPKEGSGFKSFPLRSRLVEADHPIWDGGGLTADQEDAFLGLESRGEIEDYDEVTNHVHGHKFGGYPSFCQSGVDLAPHQFVFQISSDEKIGLNVIDNGSLTFWRNPENGSWKLYYDFY